MHSASKKPTGKEKFLFLYNPTSGKRWSDRFDRSLRALIAKLDTPCSLEDIRYIKWPSFSTRVTQENITRIIIIGGDGSLRYTIEKMYHNNIDIEIAFIANGSANVAARSLGIPLKLAHAFHTATTKPARLVDIGIINKKHVFFIALVCGKVAEITTHATRHEKNLLGALAYGRHIPRLFRNYMKTPITITTDNMIDNTTINAHSIIVCNHLNIHALSPKRNIVHDDGKLDLFVIKNKNFGGLLWTIKQFYRNDTDSNLLTHIQFDTMRIHSEKHFCNTIHVDGDTVDLDNDTLMIETAKNGMQFVY